MDWPTTLVAYHRTKEFTHETIPDKLLSNHDLKPGTWALVRVLEGEVGLVDLNEAREGMLTPKVPGFIEPDMPHHLVLHGPMRLYIEFYRDASIPDDDEESP